MKASLESEVGRTPVIVAGVIPARTVGATELAKDRPAPFAGQTMPPEGLREPAGVPVVAAIGSRVDLDVAESCRCRGNSDDVEAIAGGGEAVRVCGCGVGERVELVGDGKRCRRSRGRSGRAVAARSGGGAGEVSTYGRGPSQRRHLPWFRLRWLA